MTTSTIATCDHGIVARTKRVIMDRDVYDKKWKLGPFAKKKEDLKKEGKLDKFGRVVDSTPEAWKMLFGDAEKAVNINEVAQTISGKGKDAPKAVSVPAAKPTADSESEEEVKEKKRDKKDKKEKKEKKEKKSKKAKKSDSDSD